MVQLEKIRHLHLLSLSEITTLLQYIDTILSLHTVYQREIFTDAIIHLVENENVWIAALLKFCKINKIQTKIQLQYFRKNLLEQGNYMQYTFGWDQTLREKYKHTIISPKTLEQNNYISKQRDIPWLTVKTLKGLYKRNINRDLNTLLY